MRIDKPYRFDTDEGPASLKDLFRGRSQLLVYHFMFGPDYTAGCPSCSAIADGFDGFVVHLAHHDVTLAAVSRAPLAGLRAYKRRSGSQVPSRFIPASRAATLSNVQVTLQPLAVQVRAMRQSAKSARPFRMSYSL